MEGVLLESEVVSLLEVVDLDLYLRAGGLCGAVGECLGQGLNELDIELDVPLQLLRDQVRLVD